MIRLSPHASPELIALLRKVCQTFIFPGVGGSQQLQMMAFFDWLGQQKDWLNCNAAFATNPQTQTMTIVISVSRGQPEKVQ